MASPGATSRIPSLLQAAAVVVVGVLAVGAGIWFGYGPRHEAAKPGVTAAGQLSAPAPKATTQASPAATPAPPMQHSASLPAVVAAPAAVESVKPPGTAPLPPQPSATAAVAPPTSTPAKPATTEAAPQPPAAVAATPQGVPPTLAEVQGGPTDKPSFDIVRVNPEGAAVMAGRAAPGAEVTVAENGKEIGTTKADERGEWVQGDYA